MLILAFGAIFMLAVSIFIHELGHLLCGMLVGVKARIFSIGYGRGIWKKKIGETTYQITGIPLGGYVMFKGDEYGKRLKGEPGELLSTPPLKRMIPVLGGPFANLVLGFVLLFVLELTGSDSPSNRIFIDPGIESNSPAYEAGLRSNDVITEINGESIENFEDIFAAVSLSKGDPIQVSYRRGESDIQQATLVPNLYSAGGRPTIGVEPAGERRVVATFTYSEQISEWMNQKLGKSEEAEKYFQERMQERIEKGELSEEVARKINEGSQKKDIKARAVQYLNDGDVLLSVNGTDVYTITELQRELGKFRGEKVDLKVDRKTLPLLNPWATREETVRIPVIGADVIEFKNLKHSKFEEWNLDEITIASYDPEIGTRLYNLMVDGKRFSQVEDLVSYIQKNPGKRTVRFSGREYTADVGIRPIGLLGFRPSMKFHPETHVKDQNVFQALFGAGEKVYQNVATTLKGIGMLFTGFLSPKDNLSGPIGIVQFAGLSLEYGWRTYLDFVAKISIALMIMNLLPIPIADGGHIVMYAYEAIAGRPLPRKVMEAIFRLGFFFLIGLFIFVSFNDVLRFF